MSNRLMKRKFGGSCKCALNCSSTLVASAEGQTRTVAASAGLFGHRDSKVQAVASFFNTYLTRNKISNLIFIVTTKAKSGAVLCRETEKPDVCT